MLAEVCPTARDHKFSRMNEHGQMVCENCYGTMKNKKVVYTCPICKIEFEKIPKQAHSCKIDWKKKTVIKLK